MNVSLRSELDMDRMSFRSCTTALQTPLHRSFQGHFGRVRGCLPRIYSDHPEEYLKHIREVLRRLRASDLYAKAEKCAFSEDTTDCLGFGIGPDGLQMDNLKIKSSATGRHHEKVRTSNRSWFANFYRRFIASYFDNTVPLTWLTCKSSTPMPQRGYPISS